MNYRTKSMAVAFALVLTACGQPAAQTPPTPPTATAAPIATATDAPTSVATAAPTAAPAPTAVPSPAPAGVLPTPLLFVDEGSQIVRLDVDGKTRTTLAHEPATIMQFAPSPDGATIAYITIDESQRSTLVRIGADGANRTELAHGTIRGLTVAHDGSVQAGAMFDSAAADGQALAGGAWSFPADGGAPTLLVASTEPTADNAMSGVHYQPSAWSADSTQLLMTLTPNTGPDGPGGDIGSLGWALYDAASGQTRELLSMGQEPLCVNPAWSRAGDAIYCANGGAIPAPTPGLWRLSLGDGAQQVLIKGSSEPFTLVLAPADLADGLYVMVGESTPEIQRYTPERIGPDGAATPLLSEPIEAGYDGGLWAADGSGLVVGRPVAGASRVLVWQPLGSGEPVDLTTGNIGQILWANE